VTEGQPVGREELGRELRQRREATGMSARAAARVVGFSQSKMSRIESGRTVPSEPDVQQLGEAYGATEAEIEALLNLVRAVQARNRRLVINRDPAALQQRIGKMEKSAKRAGTFQLGAVPGLLQTEEYIRAIFARSPYTASQVDEAVAGRIARQAAAAASTTTRYTQLLTESAVTWRALPTAGLRAQVDRIIECMDWPAMTVGIVPGGREVDVFPLHGFELYDETSVLVGLWTASAWFDEPQDVAAYVALFRHLETLAVYGDEARELLRRVSRDWT
jgi:transcriptional regulator with XRE-family HTH domain